MKKKQGRDVETDEDGNVKASGAGVGAVLLEGFRYLCMISMYGGATGIVVALFDMTRANADGSGSLFPWKTPQPLNISEAANGQIPAVGF